MLREKLKTALKDAMLAKDARRTATLRLVLAAVKDRDIALRTEEAPEKDDDAMIRTLLSKMIKQREESIAAYQQGGRKDLVEQEAEEIAIIQEYLPKQMGEPDIRKACEAAVKAVQAEGLKDIGKVMAELKGKHAGAMDFGKASQIVKTLLS
ncbi:MAG TPA: GatB/YqeY domain-containing protein [Sphingomonadales bacterium]|nr:GatB/YqeY domain-containing protein [Sphingomonadales bacterium]